MKVLGTGEDRNVFLCYKQRSGKPSRFHVQNVSGHTFDTTKLVNIALYERSIRNKASDNANVLNYVYLTTSPGFYPVSPWLVKDGSNSEIKGFLITEYNGREERRLGTGLKDGEVFSQSFSWLSNDTPKTTETVRIKFGVNRVEQVASLPKDADGTPTGELGVLYVVTDEKNYYMTQIGVDDLGNPTYDYVETYDTWDGLVGT